MYGNSGHSIYRGNYIPLQYQQQQASFCHHQQRATTAPKTTTTKPAIFGDNGANNFLNQLYHNFGINFNFGYNNIFSTATTTATIAKLNTNNNITSQQNLKQRTTKNMMSGYNNYCDINRKSNERLEGGIRINKRNTHSFNNYYNSSNNKLFDGLTHIVNGIFNSTLNCDFYYPEHRYNSNNLEMKSNKRNSNVNCNINNNNRTTLSQRKQQQQHMHTITVKTNNINNSIGSKTKEKEEKNLKQTMAIFSDEDFPELPKPKKILSLPSFSWNIATKMNNNNNNNNIGNKRCSIISTTTTSSSCDSKKTGNLNNIENSYHNNKNTEDSSSDSTSLDDFVIINKNNCVTNDIPNSTSLLSSSSSSSTSSSSSMLANSYLLDQFEDQITKGTSLKRTNRLRNLSECSDDSFVICFKEDVGEGLVEYHSDIDEEDEEDGENDDSDCNEENIENKNNTVNSNRHQYDLFPQYLDDNQPDSGFADQKEKKVRFNTKPEIHMMHVWDYAYRAARRGSWENYARDRLRFKHRIENLEYILNPILDKIHRNKIYNERFADDQI